jgi:hypothetical protein
MMPDVQSITQIKTRRIYRRLIMNIDINKIDNMEFEGVDFRDYPDFVDAFLAAADYDGKEMTDEQIDYVNDTYYEFVNEQVYESLF